MRESLGKVGRGSPLEGWGFIWGYTRAEWSIIVSYFLEHKNVCRGRGRFLNLCYFLGTQGLDNVQHCQLLSKLHQKRRDSVLERGIFGF